MRATRAVSLAVLISPLCAQTSSVHDLLAGAHQRIESADLRATGHLVWVPANGPRVSYPITIKARWFPGVLRIRADMGQPAAIHRDVREHILLEMRPNGENTIRIASPGDTAAHILTFEKWNVHPLTPGFTYEDLLEQQYFWPGQSIEGKAKFGTRDCEMLKSTPSAADRTYYAEVKTWIDPTIGFPVYAEKTVKETGAVKQFTYFGIRHEEGIWSAHQIEVKTRGQSDSSLLIIDRGSTKANLKLNDFDPGLLIHF